MFDSHSGRVVLEILQKALHEVFALLLRPHDGTQLGVDDSLHHVDGRCAGLETDAVPPALPTISGCSSESSSMDGITMP